ncbi:MAG: STAS domain-containing protein [Planctomycetota bacterium]
MISKVQGVTVAGVHVASLIDGPTIEGVAKGLYELVDRQACRKLIVDFGSVSSMASWMLGVLVNLNKKSREINGKVVLCGIRPKLMEVFKITRLDKILDFAKNESQAMREF